MIPDEGVTAAFDVRDRGEGVVKRIALQHK